MSDGPHRTVLLSYSWKDRVRAAQVRDAIIDAGLDTWMDIDQVQPGQSISGSIVEGLRASDFYLVLVSENSNASNWVRREIALAVELADKKKLTPIPLLLDDVDVPLEFKGLLYVDARKSLQAGISDLIKYLRVQDTTIGDLDKRMVVRKSEDVETLAHRYCQEKLRTLTSGDLRFHMTDKLTIYDIRTLWFDLFNRKMEDETPIISISLCTIELLDRARRESCIPTLIDLICRNHPKFAGLI
jgi:TIR domain